MKNYPLKIIFLFALLLFSYFLWIWISDDPYSSEKIQEKWHAAYACNNEAIDYLGDYYEKIGEEEKLRGLIKMQAACRSDAAKSLQIS